MAQGPLVSVIMPVYNGERFLRAAVESILGQTFGELEFLIVDDGSTDGTGDILREYSTMDHRVRIVRQDHTGYVEALNKGCHLATGAYIARMDADDVSLPFRLELQVARMEQQPDVGLLGGAVRCIDASDQLLQPVQYPLDDEDIREGLRTRTCLAHPAVIYRKKVFDAAGGYRTAFMPAEDYDLWLRMVELIKAANLAQEILHYRIHSGQVSSLRAEQQALSALGARVSARLRQATGHDPFDDADRVTPKLLTDLGVDRSEIGRAIYLKMVHTASARMVEGNHASAISLLDKADETVSGHGLSIAYHADTWLMYASASSKGGLGARAWPWLLRKMCRHPWAILTRAVRYLLGAGSARRGDGHGVNGRN